MHQQSYPAFANKDVAWPTSHYVQFSAHSLTLLQDVMEAPGRSATTELLPSTSTSQDEAPMLHEQPSEDVPVLQVDILPKAQVCSNAAGLYIILIKC